MGRYVAQYDKDYMKMAMLKQEETFRQQVHELHRLYRVQKLLMNDMKAELKRQRKCSNACNGIDRWAGENDADSNSGYLCYGQQKQRRAPRQVLDLELPAEEYIGKDGGEGAMQEEGEEESDLELTLATGGGSRRRRKDSPFTSDSGASFSSSSTTESGGMRLNGSEWQVFQVPDMNLGGCQRERKNKFVAEEQIHCDERASRPPWFFQCLSLNMA